MSSNSNNTTKRGRDQQQSSPDTQGSIGPPRRQSRRPSPVPSTQQQSSSSAPRQLGLPYAVGTPNFLLGAEQNVQSDAQAPQPQDQAPVADGNAIGGAGFTDVVNGGRLEGPYPVGSQYAGFRPPPPSQVESESIENLPIRQRQSYPMESAYDGRFPRYDTLSEQNVNEARGRRYPMPEANIRPVQPPPGQASRDPSDARARQSQQPSAPAVLNMSSTYMPGSNPPRRRDEHQQ